MESKPLNTNRKTFNLCFLFFALCLLTCRSASALRIISLLPSNTETLEALGAEDQIVAVTRYDRPNPKFPNRAIIGDLINPNLELMVSLHPELVVGGDWASSRIMPQLRARGYRLIEVKNPISFEEIYESIRILARAIEQPQKGEAIIHQMKGRLADIEKETHRLSHRFRTYIEIDRPLWTVGGRDFLSEAVTLAGGDNIFHDLTKPAAQVSSETIVKRNPDLIILLDAKREELRRRPGWNHIQAVKTGFIIDDLSTGTLSHPSPEIVKAIEELALRIQRLSKWEGAN